MTLIIDNANAVHIIPAVVFVGLRSASSGMVE
jgi:hypothetical protein